MDRFWKDAAIAVFVGLVLPGIALNYAAMVLADGQQQEAEQGIADIQVISSGEMLTLITQEGVRELSMEEYLVGVLLAEMPASFHIEALKAQSVVARTYARKVSDAGAKHGVGILCADPACCQGYQTPEAYLSRGGTQEHVDKMYQAVSATSDEALYYDGGLIEATYFSCSGGETEAAVAVWGTDFPYLQSVASPGEEAAAYYRDTVSFLPSEFAQKLGITPSGRASSWLGPVTYTEGGGVATMEIGGKGFTGTEIRSRLGLRSTAMTISASDTQITVTTRGYGHRVGMSQYGADAMACAGSNYADILAWYYPGTQIQPPVG